ncbi:MAG: hypothetical protein AAFW01_05950 [Pseudomonadota bacterium]
MTVSVDLTQTAPGRGLRRLRRSCGSAASLAPRFTQHRSMAERTVLLVTVFYAVTLFQLYRQTHFVYLWGGNLASKDLLWPLWWTAYVPQDFAQTLLASLYLLAGLAGVFFWRFHLPRVLVSVALLQNLAFGNMDGSINHGGHEWFWISVVFWFLPTGSARTGLDDRLWRVRMIIGYAAAAGLILLFYALSGLWKVADGVGQLVSGEFGAFHPDAMAAVLARRSMETLNDPLMAWMIIDVPLLGWPLFMGLYYVELVAILVVFRPELIRVWGVILVLFHIGTLTFMQIIFPDHVLINLLLFFLAPWAIARLGWREVAVALPVFGIVFEKVLSIPSSRARGGGAPALARSSGSGS